MWVLFLFIGTVLTVFTLLALRITKKPTPKPHGYKYVSVDMEAIELKVLSDLNGDKVWKSSK